MDNDWLNNLRKKMENHTQEVPDDLWEDIRFKLFEEKESKAPIIPFQMNDDLNVEKNGVKDDTRKNLWYRIGGIAAIILLFFTLGRFMDFNGKKENLKTEKFATKSEEKLGEKISGPQKLSTARDRYTNDDFLRKRTDESSFNFDRKKKYNQFLADHTLTNDASSATFFWTKEAFEIQKEYDEKIAWQNTQSASQKEQRSPFEDLKYTEEVPTHELLTKEEQELKKKLQNESGSKLATDKSNKKWMVGVLTGNTSSNSTDQFPGYATLNGTTLSLPEIWSVGFEDDPLMQILLANQDKKVDAKIKHKAPVTFGTSVYRNIGKKWGIATGINYTKLSAEVVSGSNDNYIRSEQQVHYLGLPVQISYNVIQKGAFTGYVTGGGVLEKAISGQIKTRYFVDGLSKEETQEEISEKPVQISVNTALGFQLKVLKHVGVYAEPGIGYHFNDNSNLKTIYKEKPVNFNLKFGIRVLLD